MKYTIREMREQDRSVIFGMMKVFYASPAVFSNGSDEIFLSDIDACLGDNPFLEGFVMEAEGQVLGYVMVAKSFSTEFGKPCMWIEDIYIKDEHRGMGLGKLFMDFVTDRYHDCIFRLEVEAENERALALYKKCGFTVLPYMEMKK